MTTHKDSRDGVNLILGAQLFAMEAHAGQVRKYTGEAYFEHCAAVANRVAQQTDDAEVIVAAYLHDVIEDTDVTYLTLVFRFGYRIATIVQQLTDQFTHEKFPGANRRDRKRWEALRMRGISDGAKLIKLADIEDNTSSIVKHDPKFAAVFLREKADMLSCLTGGDIL